MEGVILFADDHVFESGRNENKLFQKFNIDENFSVLPINNLSTLEKTVKSISTFKALILDWNFKRKIDGAEDEIVLPDENPYEFLKNKKIYSLVYVYSQNEVPQEIKDELSRLYSGKIFFERKENADDESAEYDKIIRGINDFEGKNKHLTVPFVWSQTINQSAQAIFSELEQADPNWIKEIYDTAQKDGTEPNLEVISIFQQLLSEQIIQDAILLESIKGNVVLPEIKVTDKEESSAKLFHRIYYTKLEPSAPLMTGDIIMLDNETAIILISPECDVNQNSKLELEFLLVTKTSFSEYLKKTLSFTIGNKPSNKQSDKIEKIFNQEEVKVHVLPSFPFIKDQLKTSALVDFQTGLFKLKKEDIVNSKGEILKDRYYKLNSPFIYQLRQRYLAYVGRVGVPAIPQSLRLFNLK